MDILNGQIDFLVAAEQLKQVERRTSIIGGSRRENSAEHSWHLMLMAMTLQDYAAQPVDLGRVMQMLALHDLGEIEAGDKNVYIKTAADAEGERSVVERLCSSLPASQQQRFVALWEEFEAQATPEAIFAAALDRLPPILQNYHNQGGSWVELNITLRQALEKNRHIEKGAPELWQFVLRIFDEMAAEGYLAA